MIPTWRTIQKNNFRDWELLATYLKLSDEQRLRFLKKTHFPLNLPQRLAAKIQKKTLQDPILKQLVPLTQEQIQDPDFQLDPLSETLFQPTPRLLHKYSGRVLLITTSACAMHCRYCFRKHFDYPTKKATFGPELEYISNDPSIQEVILSGGDPLSLSNVNLNNLLDSISSIQHVKRIRFHSRFPIGIPERIDTAFLTLLENCPKQIWFVIHCNHPLELDSDVVAHLNKIQQLGIPLLNQSVLLHEVNDEIDTLIGLSTALIDAGITPYYLHHLDPVQGTTHFAVDPQKGTALIAAMQTHLPGYAIPNYVQELPGKLSKTLVKI